MDKREYVKLFERKLVHHCTPTLAGIKPGSLFVCRDESVPGLGRSKSGIISARDHERNLIRRGIMLPDASYNRIMTDLREPVWNMEIGARF